MAKGNWDTNVCKGKPKCRFCRKVVNKNTFVRINGIFPAHKICAESRNAEFTMGPEINIEKADGVVQREWDACFTSNIFDFNASDDFKNGFRCGYELAEQLNNEEKAVLGDHNWVGQKYE